ncbi:hypothetical protein [Microvirga yunnanensis]|nr:hypothetical protein [Microvirga sp. HBU67655]
MIRRLVLIVAMLRGTPPRSHPQQVRARHPIHDGILAGKPLFQLLMENRP